MALLGGFTESLGPIFVLSIVIEERSESGGGCDHAVEHGLDVGKTGGLHVVGDWPQRVARHGVDSPTHAGIDPQPTEIFLRAQRFPRACGDRPAMRDLPGVDKKIPPRIRG